MAFVGEFNVPQLTTKAKLLIKSLNLLQMSNRIPSVETKVENSKNAEAIFVKPQ